MITLNLQPEQNAVTVDINSFLKKQDCIYIVGKKAPSMLGGELVAEIWELQESIKLQNVELKVVKTNDRDGDKYNVYAVETSYGSYKIYVKNAHRWALDNKLVSEKQIFSREYRYPHISWGYEDFTREEYENKKLREHTVETAWLALSYSHDDSCYKASPLKFSDSTNVTSVDERTKPTSAYCAFKVDNDSVIYVGNKKVFDDYESWVEEAIAVSSKKIEWAIADAKKVEDKILGMCPIGEPTPIDTIREHYPNVTLLKERILIARYDCGNLAEEISIYWQKGITSSVVVIPCSIKMI